MDAVFTPMSGVGCSDEAGRWWSCCLYCSVCTVAGPTFCILCYESSRLLAASSLYAGGLKLASLNLWFYRHLYLSLLHTVAVVKDGPKIGRNQVEPELLELIKRGSCDEDIAQAVVSTTFKAR